MRRLLLLFLVLEEEGQSMASRAEEAPLHGACLQNETRRGQRAREEEEEKEGSRDSYQALSSRRALCLRPAVSRHGRRLGFPARAGVEGGRV